MRLTGVGSFMSPAVDSYLGLRQKQVRERTLLCMSLIACAFHSALKYISTTFPIPSRVW